jgi:hypothetical protein
MSIASPSDCISSHHRSHELQAVGNNVGLNLQYSTTIYLPANEDHASLDRPSNEAIREEVLHASY